MRRTMIRYCLVGALAVSASAAILFAQAKFNVKLGLWENTGTMENMPPQQPQKICITAEKLANGAFDDPSGSECKHKVTGQTATTMDVTSTCANKDMPEMAGTATLHLQALSPTSVKGSIAMALNMNGRSMTMNGTFTSKFIAADCGDVK